MKNTICLSLLTALLLSCGQQTAQRETASVPPPEVFIRVSGPDLLKPDGEKLFIKGTNLGNWLNPEGYMFGFRRTNSPALINRMFCEMVGPDFTAGFWKRFKDHYITREDIEFIASTGANTIRLPFHYKLFTDEDYMGLGANQDGFARIDSAVSWCRDNSLYLILDMHDAPGGQTGDNIDDSYGYPWLFESEASQQLFCDIWKKIASHYRNETAILGYDLINEPVAPHFENMEELNGKLEPLYKRAVKAIREVDANHIVLLGGAQWNGNFKPLKDAAFDDKLMYTCHRYGGEPTKEAILKFITFRDNVNRPMYMGEIGHNTDEWQASFCRTMEENNIGYTFWPYKKKDGSSFVGIVAPEAWQTVIDFSEAPRGTYKETREARPDQETARKAMNDFIEAAKFKNCIPQDSYIRSLKLTIDK
jgi:aryl-phospho-beta-D-glucosidase BglC (GH1 family)